MAIRLLIPLRLAPVLVPALKAASRATLPRAFAALLFAASPAALAQLPPVPTAIEPVTNVYHGVSVRDDYQWLENAGDPRVREWTRQQNERTRAWFDKIPFHDGVVQELTELLADESASYGLAEYHNGAIFATYFKPPAQQPVLVRLNSLYPPALRRVVFDPNAWNSNGTTAMDWFTISANGNLAAICLSENGSEKGVLHFFETATGRPLADVIPGVQFPTGGGSAAWNASGDGVFYTRYPRPGERPDADSQFYQQIWFHKLGAPASADTYELGRDFPRIAEIELTSSADGQWTLASVANGDGGEYAHYLRNASGAWRQITHFEDGINIVKFGHDAALYLLSKRDAPHGKILRLPLAETDAAKAAVAVPEGRGVIADYAPSAHGVYVSEMAGGPSDLWYYPASGSPVRVQALPISTVTGLHSWRGGEVVFENSGFLNPPAWFEWEPGLKSPRPTAYSMTSPANFNDIEVVREYAVSKDGTKIPISILRKKGVKLDGSNPTLLTGYGGYGVSLTPAFSSSRRLWFDAGGVYAVANLRGGGEFGEKWHQAGNLTHKQNVFDDFEACAQYLIQRHYTSRAKLAVMGSSNGGLLMGAFLTQRPSLAKAVVSRVGIYDMLRVELDPNGAFNTTEFGSVNDLAQFQALYAYSPYHHVTNGTPYPAILFPCGDNDGRVNPAHSRKMIARLQAATSSGLPILLRTTATAGHGMGSSLKDRVAEQADIYTFLFVELGVDAAPWTFK